MLAGGHGGRHSGRSSWRISGNAGPAPRARVSATRLAAVDSYRAGFVMGAGGLLLVWKRSRGAIPRRDGSTHEVLAYGTSNTDPKWPQPEGPRRSE